MVFLSKVSDGPRASDLPDVPFYHMAARENALVPV